MIKKTGAALLLTASAWLAASSTSGQESKLRFPAVPTIACPQTDAAICGFRNPEDLDRAAGSRWVVVAGLAPGSLYRVNTRSRRVNDLLATMQVAWDRRRYQSCPGPIDGAELLSHGVAVDRLGARLHVINHGGREAIEVFALHRQNAMLTWIGCVPLPHDVVANSVAALPGDGIAITNFGTATPSGFQLIVDGRVTGDVRIWSPRDGWRTLPGSQGSGPNGILADARGHTIYVARSGTRDVVRINLRTGQTLATSARLPIMPDNLRWRHASALIVTGMALEPAATLRCFAEASCRPPAAIVALSPGELSFSLVATLPAGLTGGPATTALPVGLNYWLGSFRGNRIDIVRTRPPIKNAP